MSPNPADAAPDPDATTCLTAATGGRWTVHTRNATHTWDLDAMTYTRHPGPKSSSFPHDNTTVAITRVDEWPEIGKRSVVWFDDPDTPDTVEQWRASSTIATITRAEPS
ncbi:hypothetical protein JAAN108728_06900 [Janibacter anophelis]